MFRTKLFLAGAMALALSLAATPGFAQIGEPRNQITFFTFSAPFELPGGQTLPAGKYAFELLDSMSNRHIVKIMSEDQSTLHATIMAIPAQRMEPSGEPEVRFMEAPANMPPAIRTWWYPGRVIGHEFIYPKDHARRLAANQAEPVLTTAGDETDMKTADLARIDRSGQETAYEETRTAEATTEPVTEQATPQTAEATPQTAEATPQTAEATPQPETAQQPQMTEQRAPETMPEAERQTTPQPERDTTEMSTRTQLPQTASPLPLFALLGVGSLLGARAIRRMR